MRLFNVSLREVFTSRLFILSCFFLLSGLKFSAVADDIDTHNVDPVYSKMINGTCLVVGNANTRLSTGKVDYGDIANVADEKKALEYVLADGLKNTVSVDGGGSVNIYNSSFANFCIPKDLPCGDVSIELGQLNWGGRVASDKTTLLSERTTVYIKIGDSPVYKVDADEYVFTAEKDYYSCHADISKYIKKHLSAIAGQPVSIYVGNIAASLDVINEASGTSNVESPTASGWSLDLVYSSPSLPRRNIAVYNYDKLQISNTVGNVEPALNPQFKFAWSGAGDGEAFDYSMCDTITLIYSAFGGMKKIDDDALFFGTGGAVFDLYDDLFKITYLNDKNQKMTVNHFSSSIDYEYDTDGCNVGKSWQYSPGYDLHAITIDPGEPGKFKKLARGADAFSLYIKPANEHHFVTNVAIVTGAPETPQAQIYTRTPESVEPGTVYKTDINFAVGENKEGMANLVITVPISEYIDSITSIETKCLSDIVKKSNSSSYYSVCVKPGEESGTGVFTEYCYPFSEFCNGAINKNQRPELFTDINKYLIAVDEHNDKNRFVDPADFRSARLVFTFKNVVVPKEVKKTDVWNMTFNLKTKKEGDPVYFQTTYVNKRPSIAPEAELSLTTQESGEHSMFGNTLEDPNYWDNYRCMLNGGGGDGYGGGGGGGCVTLDGSQKSEKGVFVRQDSIRKPQVIVSTNSVCRPVPDSISFTICSPTVISINDLNYQLVSKKDFDIDSIARIDSCIWEERKRDSLIAFAQRHGVNKSRLEKLLSDVSGTTLDFAATAVQSYGCDNGEAAPQSYIDSVELILNAKIRPSRLFALYGAADTTKKYLSSASYVVSPPNYNVTYTVDGDTTLYLYYQSPWVDGNGDSCSKFIPVHFHKRQVPAPEVTYDSEILSNQDTVYLCLEGNLAPFSITKDRGEYDLYASLSKVEGSTLADLTDFRDVMLYNGFSKVYNWKATDPDKGAFSSAEPGLYRFAVRQQTLNCKSDSVVFFVSVADMKIENGPVIDDSQTEFCQALSPTDSITLSVVKTPEQQDYLVRWYNTRTTQAKAELIGTGDVINVRQDSAETYRYGATFFNNKCESDTSIILIVVNPAPDTISPDTIPVCQRYHLTEADVMQVLKMKKTGASLSPDKVKFYKYIDASGLTVEENVWTSIHQDSLMLGTLLEGLDFESACQEGGVRYLNFVAQAMSDKDCPGPGSLITIKINCYEETQPKFGLPGDSILYCMGSKGSADFDNFLAPEEKNQFSKGYKWFWFDATKDDHYTYSFGNDYYKTGENSAPVVDPSFVHSDLITVVRVDSNNCISLHDTFKVVVDTSINTYPIIADSVIPVADKRFTLTYCKGDYSQPTISIPAVGFPSADYRVEWYEKDDLNTICNGIDSSGIVMQPSVVAALEKADTAYYCVRQSTQMGCTGPWLTVQVVVYPDVSGEPTLGKIPEYCMGAIPVPATVNAENPDPDAYMLTYYRIDTTHVDGVVVKDTVAVPNIVPDTRFEGVTTYYAALRDKKTKCQSPLFEIPVKVNHKPGSVVYSGDSVIMYCAEIGDVDLAKDIPAKINTNDYDTRLMWLPSEVLSTNQAAKVAVGVYQKDTVTGCLGDTTTLAVKVEKTFRYTPWSDRTFCWGETINVCDSIKMRIRPINHYIDSTSIGFEVRRMVGKTAAKDPLSCDVLSALQSKAGRHESDTTAYQITVLDSVSGCLAYDTVTIVFRGLPNAEPEKVEEYCEAFPTKLPTPDNKDYTYKWLRENGSESSEIVTLDVSEVFSLVEFDEFLCSDTFKVEVNVHSKPLPAPVSDLKLCQDGSEVVLSDVVSPDAEHLAENLQIQYFNHMGDSIPYKISTDTIAISGLKRVLTFKARQTDLLYGCYNESTFKVELSKGLSLQAPDMKAVCQPDTVDLAKHVKTYLSENLESVHLPNLGGVTIEYGRLVGGVSTSLTDDEAAQLVYVDGRDSVTYIYSVTDASNTCSASDTLFVVINKQPETPLVENGVDSLFFCVGNDPFVIGAENKNPKSISSAIFWDGISDAVPADSITVDTDVEEKLYSAYSKNLLTGCISVSDTVAVVIAKAIKVTPIAKNDTLELCAGEVMNVAEAAEASFSFDEKRLSKISVLAAINGVSTPMQALTAVTSTAQDTINYEFKASDELTGCEAANRLVLIFHKKPSVGFDAPKVVCQGTDAELKAVGETRPVSYAWYLGDDPVVASTQATLLHAGVQEPVTFKLVETLSGTLCSDSAYFDLDVVVTPAAFTDSAFVFCQQSDEEWIHFSRPAADDVYSVEWADDQKTVVSSDENLPVDLATDTVYVRYARQVNAAKGLVCPSEWAKADVKINKHIDVTLPDTFMCHPFEFNLAKFAASEKEEAVSGYQLAVDRVFLVGGMGALQSVADSSAVVEGGKYQIEYKDKNGCRSTAVTKLDFIDKPATPIVDVADPILLCQGADTFITVNKVAGDYVYHWLPVGGNDTISADTLKISAALATSAALQVWRQDAKYGCESDKAEFKYSVVDSITTNLIDVQHICDGETLDLDSLGRLAFNFNDELSYAYYPLSADGEKGSQMLQTGAVGTEGAYLVTANNAASGCNAKAVLNIDIHDNPVLMYKGSTVLCENDTFRLVAYTDKDMPDPKYTWTVDGGMSVSDSVLTFIAGVNEPHVALEQKAVLQGTYVITNKKSCVSEQEVTLLTNPAPDALSTSVTELCQNTGVVTLPVEYEQSSYNLEITANNVEIPEIVVNTDKVSNYVYTIRQIDRLTMCKSPAVAVYANVHPAISLDLADEVYVCEPETYDLLAVANDIALVNNAFISELKELSIVSVVCAGDTIENADQLDKSGTYVVTIADQYNCQAHDQIAVNFVAKPSTPVVDAASPILLCQGADTFITVKPVVGNYIYHWLPKGTIDTVTTDSYAVVAKFASAADQVINVWRQDADHGCESEKAEVSYRVVDSITTNLIDVQHICDGEALDLDSLGRLAFNFNDELSYAYYPLSADGEKGSQMLQTGAVGTEGAYLVTAYNAASGCNAKAVLNIDVHDNPVLMYKGATVLCENDTFRLVAFTDKDMPDPKYTWTVDGGMSVSDSVLTFIAGVNEPHVALEQKAVLQGTYVITNKKNCVSEQEVTLLTNAAPDPLPSDTVELCQNTGIVTLPVEYEQASFNLEITADANVVPEIVVNTAEVANYAYTIRQIDRMTNCKSPMVPVYVNVHPAISLKLPEIAAICQPAVVDFVSVVDKATIESNAAVAENKQIKTMAYYFNGVEIEDASALDKSGTYRAVIEDQYGCQASDEVAVSVGLQPEMVKADTGFCQSTGDRLLAGNGTSSMYALQWLALSTAYPDSIYSDSLMVSTVTDGEYAYLMRQVDRNTGCPSEASPITVTIYPALSVSLRDTMLCYGETFNFVDYAAGQVKGGTNPVLDHYGRTVAISPLAYDAVAQKGDFYAVYTDEHACSISDTMLVDFAPEIKVSVSSNAPVCEGDTLKLVADGADFYAWNNMGATAGTYDIVTTEDGTLEVPLKAGIRVANLTCEIDSVLSYVVKVVPDLLPVADTVVAYCQGTVVEPLMLTPSLEGAKVLWYSPADGYQSVAQNGTLVPSSQTAGTSVFRFRQQLDGCMTDTQEVTVEIQPAITDLPATSDTAYCLNEPTVPLLAKVENPLYDVVWTNADGDTLPLGYKPSSAEAGMQLYQARLHYRACYGKPVPERVTVSLPYGEKPDVDASFIFCQNTGDYTLQANSIPSGARLNWYTTIGGVRYDSIVVPTADGAVQWTSNSYYVTQSVIDGCESDPKEIVVDIKPSSENKMMAVDTCANLQVKIANVFERNGVTDVLDTLWRLDGGVKERVENTANIGHTATYYAATHNQWGCKAMQTVNVRMLQVEDFKYSTIKTMYCFDDTVSLSASSSNSTFEWYNPTDGETSFSDSYTFRLQGPQEIRLVATVLSMPACTDTVNYEFNTHPYIAPKVDGKMQICVGDQVQLSTSNVFSAEWSVADTVAHGDNFSFYPEQSCVVTLAGVDKNNCPVSQKLEVSTAKVPKPVIAVEPSIHSRIYHLNRDTFDVKLNAVLEDNYDEGLSYYWNFGDGIEGIGSMSEYHEYDSARVRLTKPIMVTVQVAHEYGCMGEAAKVLLIDPDIYVPNTMAAGETFMPSYELQIFDRIGNLIYEGIGWQGQKNNGDDAFADTYFYAINYYLDGDKKVKTGYITLVR